MITDKRLKKIIKTFETAEVIDGLDGKIYTIATELLSARQTIQELIEDGERLADTLTVEDRLRKQDGEGRSIFVDAVLDRHAALMKKIGER